MNARRCVRMGLFGVGLALLLTLASCQRAASPPAAGRASAAGPAAGHATADRPASQQAGAAVPAEGGRRILYYRHPMGLPDTSPVPKQDAMGMDYVPVYEDEQAGGPLVRLALDKVQKLGVRTERVGRRSLTQTLRIVGTLRADERGQSSISPRFEGWIMRLLVNTTGASVRRGQALLEVYSPDLLGAQEDYRAAQRALRAMDGADESARAGMAALAQASVARLRNWGVAEPELAALRDGEAARGTVLLRAQQDGVVTDKPARTGMRFMPGDILYQLSDLSRVWMSGSVFEQDLALVRPGADAAVSFVAYPGQVFRGRVVFISPELQAESRTAALRVELANPRGLLKPGMYGTLEVTGGSAEAQLAVPESAIIDTGTRQLLIVDRGDGRFEARPVRIGRRADHYAQVLDGVAAGEAVVVNGNFLIDSESNLRAVIGAGTEP